MPPSSRKYSETKDDMSLSTSDWCVEEGESRVELCELRWQRLINPMTKIMSGQREIEMTPCCTVEVRSIRKHVILFSYLYCITSFVVPVYGQLEVDSNSHSQGGNRRKLRSYLLKIGSLIKHQLVDHFGLGLIRFRWKLVIYVLSIKLIILFVMRSKLWACFCTKSMLWNNIML